MGYLRGEDLAAAYASADAFVYASETETMGNVILEAMACGLPVVAAAAGGVPSLVEHGIDGFLFKPRSAKEAAGYAEQLLFSMELREQISAAAVKSAACRSWREAALTVRRHYENTCRSQSPELPQLRPVSMAARVCTITLVRTFQFMAPGTHTAPTPGFASAQTRTV